MKVEISDQAARLLVELFGREDLTMSMPSFRAMEPFIHALEEGLAASNAAAGVDAEGAGQSAGVS